MSACRSCGVEIEWVLMATGKRMPVDVATSPAGNLVVIGGCAVVVPVGEGDRVSHFATCPSAITWRKP